MADNITITAKTVSGTLTAAFIAPATTVTITSGAVSRAVIPDQFLKAVETVAKFRNLAVLSDLSKRVPDQANVANFVNVKPTATGFQVFAGSSSAVLTTEEMASFCNQINAVRTAWASG